MEVDVVIVIASIIVGVISFDCVRAFLIAFILFYFIVVVITLMNQMTNMATIS